MKHKYKKGTVGYKVEQLVNKFGHYPMGHTIVQMALEQMSGLPNPLVTINGVTVGKTPGYEAAVLEENKCWGRMDFIFYRPELNMAKKYTPQGKCLAIRFAPGMTREQMEASLKRDQPTSRDWLPYNESDNTFLA